MRILANGISLEVLQALGWTLLHFVWQGAALAAVFALVNAACRRATSRYALAVVTLGARIIAPGMTFPVLRQVLLSLRTAGGMLAIGRMRRREVIPVGQQLYDKCLALQRRMRLERVIRYCQCLRLDAPAVLGWFRPVLLLPARALTGLTEAQLEAVIAHELAHIRRWDSLVNLFQIGIETLLFYHPAVWWVSQRIRRERENCCDDQAIATCGDAVTFARALTLMEEWRTTPAFMMAANRGPLSQRVFRLLGLDGPAARVRVTGLAAGLLCLAAALFAGHAFFGVAHAALGSAPVAQSQGSGDVLAEPANLAQEPKQSGASDQEQEPTSQTASAASEKNESYLDAMQALGFKNLTVDELVGLKVQGVTPAYVRAMHELGFQPGVEELIAMRVQGISPEYVRDMRASSPA